MPTPGKEVTELTHSSYPHIGALSASFKGHYYRRMYFKSFFNFVTEMALTNT